MIIIIIIIIEIIIIIIIEIIIIIIKIIIIIIKKLLLFLVNQLSSKSSKQETLKLRTRVLNYTVGREKKFPESSLITKFFHFSLTFPETP